MDVLNEVKVIEEAKNTALLEASVNKKIKKELQIDTVRKLRQRKKLQLNYMQEMEK